LRAAAPDRRPHTTRPQIIAAMWGGSPERMASVTNTLRKSWGRHSKGSPTTVIRALREVATRHSRALQVCSNTS